jgi:predicted nucleic acid-binding protein
MRRGGIRAVIDADVLYGTLARAALLTAGGEPFHLFTPLWSEVILDELARNLRRRAGIPTAKVDTLLTRIRSRFPGASIDLDPAVVRRMPNHPKDRHVLAAAVIGEASVLVTKNTRDFRGAPWLNVRLNTPDEFLASLCEQHPEEMKRVVVMQSAALQSPPLSADELLVRYERGGLPQLAARLRATRIGAEGG